MNTHGHVAFSWDEDLFIAYVEGAFNEEGVAHYIPLLQNAILNRETSEWKRLEVWDNEALGSPETLEAAKLIYDWYDNNGCFITAIVVCNSLQAKIINNVFKSNAQVFTDLSKAKQWLKAHNKPFKQDK